MSAECCREALRAVLSGLGYQLYRRPAGELPLGASAGDFELRLAAALDPAGVFARAPEP